MTKDELTFAGLPWCGDLGSIDADLVILGVPYGTPYDPDRPPAALGAPQAIRRESVRYPDDPVAWDFDLGGTLLGESGMKVVDAGDLAGDQGQPDRNREAAYRAVRSILDAGAVPLVVGGDDSVPIPVLRAYETHGPINILQMDAHLDWRDHVGGVKRGYSSTMRRASEYPWVDHIVQVGMRGVGSARGEEMDAARAYGVEIIPAASIREGGIRAVLESVPEGSPCFLTLDFDVLDPSEMPAVSAPTPGGLTYLEVIEVIRGVSEISPIVGACFVEFVPERDVHNLGAITAMRVIWHAVGSFARSPFHPGVE
ncbi:MAG: arginase family protein [Anaerolineales bacterium]